MSPYVCLQTYIANSFICKIQRNLQWVSTLEPYELHLLLLNIHSHYLATPWLAWCLPASQEERRWRLQSRLHQHSLAWLQLGRSTLTMSMQRAAEAS